MYRLKTRHALGRLNDFNIKIRLTSGDDEIILVLDHLTLDAFNWLGTCYMGGQASRPRERLKEFMWLHFSQSKRVYLREFEAIETYILEIVMGTSLGF